MASDTDTDGDKYPVDSDRRRFVKGVVGGSALIGVGTTAAAAVNTLTGGTGPGGGGTTFYGVENTAGPAPRGMPMIPVSIEEQGGEEVLVGRWPSNFDEGRQVAVEQVGDIEYSSAWFQYCGIQTKPGIRPQAEADNTITYASESKYEWQNNDVEPGDPLTVSDFGDYQEWTNQYTSPGRGKPAAGVWRSEVGSEDAIPVEVIRSPIIEEMANSGESEWLSAATERGFMAHLNKCTHFCCVPGFATSNYQGEGDAAGMIYCQCHQSVYDPFSVVRTSFVALPRPE
jgi:Rieske Fe-S protein